MKRLFVGLGLLLGCATVALLLTPYSLDAGGSVPYPMPDDLYKIIDLVPSTVVQSELSYAWIDWSSTGRYLEIRRKERPSSSDPWTGVSKQVVTTSFDISDAVGYCDGADRIGGVYVSGTYESGLATIERWTITYGGAGGLDQGQPSVYKSVVYQGEGLGSIASIAPDPQGRFVYALGYESRTVWKVPIALGGPPQIVAGTVAIGALADMKSMQRKVHATEGTKYLLYEFPRRGIRGWVAGENPVIVVLDDLDDDGVVDATEVIDRDTYEAREYDRWDTWEDPCVTYF